MARRRFNARDWLAADFSDDPHRIWGDVPKEYSALIGELMGYFSPDAALDFAQTMSYGRAIVAYLTKFGKPHGEWLKLEHVPALEQRFDVILAIAAAINPCR
jgi:hypothetical protein